ncbi:MAG TPA: sigma 54-interacting transcriptional regulator [Kofleriaceae bacterium]|nr:sigma 54-interacting transcriptional regulator [Kofleriaceae bacterium]
MARDGIADVSTAAGPGRGAEPPGRVPALAIASHPSAHRVGERVVLEALAAGHEVEVSRNAPDFARPDRVLGAPLDDPFVSRRPFRLVPLGGGGIRVVAGAGGTPVTIGAAEVGDHVDLAPEDVARGVPIELAGRVVLLLHLLDREIAGADRLGMVGDGAGIRRVRAAIERVADLAVPVLIRGETGTGKELVARAIHDRGQRRGGPFVSVNLGAIPRDLAAAELFGATRGAYTGATRDRDGLFRTAHGGTLFLDEAGEASPEVQVMLLRVLETGEVSPVGADRPVAVSVRLIAATDADLEDHVWRGQFKAPLLHRLAGYEVRIPPLRERREDIGPLFYHFAREELAATGELERLAPADPYAAPWLPAAIAAQLVRHAWPGNIRQLRNVARQLVIGSRGLPEARFEPEFAAQLAGPEADHAARAGSVPPEPSGAPRRKPAEVSEEELLAALKACKWDLKAAADRLRIPRPSIYTLIERSPRIRTAGDVPADEIAACFHACGGDLDAMAVRLQVSRRALQRRVKELGLAVRPPGTS